MTPEDAAAILSNMRAVLRPIVGDGDILEKAARVAATEAVSFRVRAVNDTLEAVQQAMPKPEFADNFAHLLQLASDPSYLMEAAQRIEFRLPIVR